MTKRFIFGCGVLTGVVIGELRMIRKAIAIPEMRNACKDYMANKIIDRIYGKRYDEYTFMTWEDAEETQNALCQLITDRGLATVADLKKLLGYSNISCTDKEFGWFTTTDIYVQPDGRYYVLYVPKPKRL